MRRFRNATPGAPRSMGAVLIVLLVSTMVLAGCADKTQTDGGGGLGAPTTTQPAITSQPGDSSTVAGAPIPADATPSGSVSVSGPTTTQSFKMTGADPQDAIDSYQSVAESAGWTATGDPTASGSTDWTLTMTMGSSTLLVTTTPSVGDTGSQQDVVELSIEVTAG